MPHPQNEENYPNEGSDRLANREIILYIRSPIFLVELKRATDRKVTLETFRQATLYHTKGV